MLRLFCQQTNPIRSKIAWASCRLVRYFSHSSSSLPPKKLAFFGSDEFSVLVLKRILAHNSALKRENLLVLSTGKPENETGSGRKNDLVKFAEREGVKIWIPVSGSTREERVKEWRAFQARLSNYCAEHGNFDLGLVCSYGNLIPSYLIDYFQGNLFVIHPSLLPKYRGASPIHFALLNGDTKTGVSVAALSPKKFDAGVVFLQEHVPVELADNYGTLVKKLAVVGGDQAIKMLLEEYPKSGLFNQNEAEVTKAPKFEADANLWYFGDKLGKNRADIAPARHIFNLCRVFKGSSHGYLKFSFRGKKVGFEDISLLEDSELQTLGKISDQLQLSCVRRFAEILPPGSLHQFKNVKELKGTIALRLNGGFILAKKVTYEGLSKTVSIGEFTKEIDAFGPKYQEFIAKVLTGEGKMALEEILANVVMLD